MENSLSLKQIPLLAGSDISKGYHINTISTIMAAVRPKKLRVCLVQLKGRDTKEQILDNISAFVREAAVAYNPRVVALPECLNGPYVESQFHEFAEVIPTGVTCKVLSDLAKELEIYLVGGTIIERDANDPKIMYNTCTVWGPDGSLVARHRKTHLCDIMLDFCHIKEVDYLKPGNGITTFMIDGIKCGVAICYDASFTNFINSYRNAGCEVMFFPSAYNVEAGERNWELVFRSRALDNQVFAAAISPARDNKAEYVAWGHSFVADPMGKMIAQAGLLEEILCVDMDLSLIAKYRSEMPLFDHRRSDIYDLVYKKAESNQN